MVERRRYRVTIEKVTREVHEMDLDGEDVMQALDEARAMVEVRNKTSHNGKYHVTRIATVKEETNELPSDVPARSNQEPGRPEGRTDWVCGHQGESRSE